MGSKVRPRLKVGKLISYSVSVSSDILAELGAGALKFIPSRIGLVATNIVAVLAVGKYWLPALAVALAVVIAVVAMQVRKHKRKPKPAERVRQARKTKHRANLVGGMKLTR